MNKSTKANSGLNSKFTTVRRVSRSVAKGKNGHKASADRTVRSTTEPKPAVPKNEIVTIDSQAKKPNPGLVRTLSIPTVKKPNVVPDDGVCEDDSYERELEKAKSVGAEHLSGAELLGFCRTAHTYFKRVFLKDAKPFFVELWRRLGEGPIPGVARTKKEACEKIGCSIRWVQNILAGTTNASNERRANKKQKGGEVTSPHVAAVEETRHEDLSLNDRAEAILRKMWEQMEDLNTKAKWPERQKLCQTVGEQVLEAARTSYVDDDSYEPPAPRYAGGIQ